MVKRSRERRRYYDVERFRRVYAETVGKRKSVLRFLRPVTHFFDSVQGILVALVGPLLVLGVVYMLALSSMFGVVGVLIVVGSVVGGLGFVLERKVGRSLQFGETSFLRSTLAQLLAFAVFLAAVFVIVTFRLGIF